MKKLFVLVAVTTLCACGGESAPLTSTQEVIQHMSLAQGNCVVQTEESHLFSGTPKDAYKLECRKNLVNMGCSVWITVISYDGVHQPDLNDIDDQCSPHY